MPTMYAGTVKYDERCRRKAKRKRTRKARRLNR